MSYKAKKEVYYVDGGCKGNQQLNYAKREMVSVVLNENGGLLSEEWASGYGSNNMAELIAIRDAMKCAVGRGVKKLNIRTDSKVAESWVSGGRVGKDVQNKEALLSLLEEINGFRKDIELRIIWIPREHNLAGWYIEEGHNL